MHIPDGFLNTGVSIAAWAGSAGGLGYALQRVNKTLGERQVPLMGVTAAFIFAAQMLNFTVVGGTSGHLLGGALAAILLGPWAGMLVLTSVLTIQALLFQDGGLLALGANIFNMGIVGVLVGWVAYTLIRRLLGDRAWAVFISGFAAGWLSVVAAAIAAAAELAYRTRWPGRSSSRLWRHPRADRHRRGLITVGVLVFLRRPSRLAHLGPSGSTGGGGYVMRWLKRNPGRRPAAGVSGGALSPLASPHPDGLERVAEDQFIDRTKEPPFRVIADYLFPGIQDERLATILAGLVGTITVFGPSTAWPGWHAAGAALRRLSPASRRSPRTLKASNRKLPDSLYSWATPFSTLLPRHQSDPPPDPRLKLLATLAFILVASSTPPRAWPAFVLLAALVLAAIAISRIPPVEVLKRSLIALPFAGMIALSLPFTQGGEPVWTWRPFGWELTVTDEGLILCGAVLVKAWLSVLAAALLLATTPLFDLLQAMRALHVPGC